MAMNPEDLKMRDGQRAPTNRISERGPGDRAPRWKQFKHRALSEALAGFGVPKVRVR